MPKSFQASSEETIASVQLRLARDIETYVTHYVNAAQREWLAAICLDRQQYLIGQPYLIYCGVECPLWEYIPIEQIEKFFVDSKAAEAHSIISFRYHCHPPLIPTEEAFKRFHDFRLQAKANGTPLRNHLSGHITGELISWRDWGQLVAIKPQGHLAHLLASPRPPDAYARPQSPR